MNHYRLFSDVNCPFCYAMHERLYTLGLMEQISWHGVFHRQSQQGAARRRNLIKPRHIFEAIEARTVQYSMDRKILRWTMVDAGRVDADSMNASFSHQKLGNFP